MANEGQNTYTGFPIELLKARNDIAQNNSIDLTRKKLIEIVSGNLKVAVEVSKIVVGHTVTRYELEMPAGVSVKKVQMLQADIKDELAPMSYVRIDAPIPGRRAAAVEIPNSVRMIVGLREALASPELVNYSSPVAFPVGRDTDGNLVVCDLNKVPHILIAGMSGSGKTIMLQAMIASLMYRASPNDVRFIIIGQHSVEREVFKDMPHMLLKDTLTSASDVLQALRWTNNEVNRRYMLFSETDYSNVSEYNKSHGENKLPRIVLVIDDFSYLVHTPLWDSIEVNLVNLAAVGRSAGIHIVISALNVCSNVITGSIKSNLTSRIAFRVADGVDSRIILDCTGAENLLGSGDMLYYPYDAYAPKRVQGAYISFKELQSVINYVKEHNQAEFDSAASDFIFNPKFALAETVKNEDPLMLQVLKTAIRESAISITVVQRRFSLGYARAARIVDKLETLGLIGPVTSFTKPREVLISREKFIELFGCDVDD